MKCPRCHSDTTAGQKFCGQCGERLIRLCPACGISVLPRQAFCGACGAALAPPATGSSAPEAYTPRHLAERILTSRSALEGERKQVTVLFADVNGAVALTADRDPEEARALIDPIVERLMDAVHRYEGTVNQVMSDGIMALFGAPLAHEDHAVRACCAALLMQETVRVYAEDVRRTAGVALSIRVGLNSGDVVVRSIGNDLFTDYSAVGQTTHLAARMQQGAPAGAIVIAATTRRLAEGFVEVRPLGRVAIKGLAEPVDAFELTGAGPARTRLQAAAVRGLTSLVGRQAELDALGQALDQARAGHGRVVALVGDAGVGKSRQVRELTHREQMHDWLVLEATATSHGQAIAFSPIAEVLKTRFGIAPRDDAAAIAARVTSALEAAGLRSAEMAGPLLGLLEALPAGDAFHALDPQERRNRTIIAVRQLLLRESAARPVLLAFEDLQWADSETVRCLDALIASLPAARICVLLTYRVGYEHRWSSKAGYAQLRIDPLPPPDAESLLDSLLGRDARIEPLRRLLVERTEGNPLFLEESVRMLVDSGVLIGARGGRSVAGDVPAVQVPDTVHAILAGRIDRLPAPDKRLLQGAAVIGHDVPASVLHALGELPPDETDAALHRLQALEFIYESRLFPEVEYSFRHGLTLEVAYASLVHERRRQLHARALWAMERLFAHRVTDHVDALARHALSGEVWDRAVDHLRGAGARAYRRGALRKALDRYEQALELLPRLPAGDDNTRRGIDVRLDLHAPLFSLGQIPRLITLHEEAARAAAELPDEPRLGRVLSRLGLYAFTDARYARGIDHVRAAHAIAERTGDAELGIVTRYLRGINDAGLGEVAACIDDLRQIVDGPDAELSKRIVGLSASPYVLSCAWLASAFSWRGDFCQADAYAERAVRAADESDHPYAQAIAYTWRVIPVAHRGDFDRALPMCEVAVQLCEKKELLGWLPFAYAIWGWVLAWAGRPAQGVPFIERAVTLFETVGIRAFLSLRYAEWAEGLLLDGKVAEARRAATRALELALAHGERASEAWARCVLGDVALAASDGSARGHYGDAAGLAEQRGLSMLLARCHLGLAEVERLAGQPAAAREHLARAAGLYGAGGSRYGLGRVDALAARLD
jgi:class 3 adenylate cyclase/tetratricopeptide (TPR) repeat protein